MKIGIDVSILVKEASGIGQYVANVLENLKEIGREHEFYLFTYDDLKLPLDLPSGWHMVYYGGKKKKQSRYLTHLPKYLKQYHIDVFLGTRPYLPLFRTKNVRYAAVVHDLIPLYMPELFTDDLVKRFTLFTKICRRNADMLIAVSEATKRDILKYLPVPEEKIHMIYEGANPAFTPEKDAAGIEQVMKKYHIDSDYILCLSTVEPRKNMLRTIQAYEQCLNENFPYKLVIVGGSGWNNGDIYEYVQNSSVLKSHVIFTGYVSDEEVKHIYANASLFIYASLCEGFGIPILEAMQSGIPVITSNTSCMPEIAGNAGELVDPYSVEQIRDAIEHILSSKETQESMIRHGIEQAKKFSWRTCAEELLELITSK